MTQQGEKAVFHFLCHGAHLGGCDVVGGHGAHFLQQRDVFGELLLTVPFLQIVQRAAHKRFLRVLQIGIPVDPPIEQIIALVVDQFEGAAARECEQPQAEQPKRHMADNSAK